MGGIGLSLPNRGVLFGATTVDEMLDLAVLAETSGLFDSVWVGDGLVAKARLESVVSLSAIAARTSRVRLGVACLATFVLRHPVLFAVQWASLDVLSAGRTQLTVCLGATTARSGSNPSVELQAMGIGPGERIPRFEENFAVLREVWSGPASFAGRFVEFDEMDLQPRPVQDPCPIWIASNPDASALSPEAYRAAIDRVGRLADGWQTTVTAPEEFGRRWDEIREAATRHGRSADAMVSSSHLMINLADDITTARDEARRFLDTYYSMKLDDATMDRWGAYGPPEHVLARLLEYVDRGLDLPILRFASYDQSAQFERASEMLLPELARRCRAGAGG